MINNRNDTSKAFTQKASRAKFWVLIGQGNSYLRFLSTLLIIGYIEPSHLGIYALATSIFSFSNLLRDFGINQGIIRAKSISALEIDTLWVTSLLTGLIISVVLYFSKDYIEYFFDVPDLSSVIIILCLDMFIKSMYQVPDALIRRELDFQKFVLIDFFSITISGVAGYWIAIYGNKMLSLPFRQLALTVITCAGIYILAKSKFKFRFSLKDFKKHALFSLPIFFISIVVFFRNQFDTLVIAKYLSVQELGVYQLSMTIAGAGLIQLIESLSRVSFATINRVNVEQSIFYFKSAQKKCIYLCIFFCGISVTSLYIFDNYLASYWADSKWISASDYFLLIIPFAIIKSLFTYNSYTLRSLGYANIELVSNIVFVLSLSVLFIGVSKYFEEVQLEHIYMSVSICVLISWSITYAKISNIFYHKKFNITGVQGVVIIFSALAVGIYYAYR